MLPTPGPIARAASLLLGLASATALGANATYQNFFFATCPTATGTLAARCAQTPGGLGNISGDSESSLNPSQVLAQNLAPIAVAQARSGETRERNGIVREDEEGRPAKPAAGSRVDIGPFSLLVNVQGVWFERGTVSGVDWVRPLDGDSRTFEAGGDYRVSDRLVVGGLAGLERSRYDFGAEAPGANFVPAASAGNADIDNTFLTLFAAWSVGSNGFIELSGGHLRGDGTYRRNSVFQESTRTAPTVAVRTSGNADNRTTWVAANGGLALNYGAWTLNPYAGFTRSMSRVDGYTEQDLTNSGLAMRISGTERDSLLGHAGLRIGRTASTSFGVFVPTVRVEYRREFENGTTAATASLLLANPANQLSLQGRALDRTAMDVGFSLMMILPNGWTPFFDYVQLSGNRDFDRQRATFGMRVEF